MGAYCDVIIAEHMRTPTENRERLCVLLPHSCPSLEVPRKFLTALA
jgi:hypothetical protein